MRARIVAAFRAIGRFVGTVIAGVFQGTFALVGDIHGQLHRQFGQRVWAFYVLGALIAYGYFTNTLGVFVSQLFAVVQQLAVLGVIFFGLWLMFRGIFGRR